MESEILRIAKEIRKGNIPSDIEIVEENEDAYIVVYRQKVYKIPKSSREPPSFLFTLVYRFFPHFFLWTLDPSSLFLLHFLI